MNVDIVVEDHDDVALLRRVLPAAADPHLVFFHGRSNGSALFTARSVRISREEPVILLLDARSVDPRTSRTSGETRSFS